MQHYWQRIVVSIRAVHLFTMVRAKPTATAPSSKKWAGVWDARRKKMRQNVKHEVEQELKREYSEKLRNIRCDFSARYKKLGQKMDKVEEKVLVLVTKLQTFMDKIEDELFFRRLSARPTDSPTLSGATSSSEEALDNGGEPNGNDHDLAIDLPSDVVPVKLEPDLDLEDNDDAPPGLRRLHSMARAK